MAENYPDIIGEYVAANQRFEVNGLQYIGIFDPPMIKAGETTQFQLFMQNTTDAPLTAAIDISLPQSGRFRGKPVLQTEKTTFDLNLGQAEAGRLVIPLSTTEKIVNGRFKLGVEVAAKSEKGADSVRKSLNKPPDIRYLDSLVGLDLVSTLGSKYTTKNGKKTNFELDLSKEPGEATTSQLPQSNYQPVWNLEMAELRNEAQRKVDADRAKIIDALQIEPLFAALYAENTERFADSGLPLRIGEAIAIGKLLTFTVHFFLSQETVQNGLLYPIWERAVANNIEENSTLEIMKFAGYKHIVRLAAALSFGMVAEQAGKHLWPEHERQEVISYIADALDEGGTMPADFLYLPLMIGALSIVSRVRLPDEDVSNTISLVETAHDMRPDVLADDDMARARQVFTGLLKQLQSESTA